MKTITLIVVVGLLVFKCSSKKTDSIDQVSGTYVREFSYKVVHPETGLEIGIRTIRDTIFIKPAGDKFEVSNHKWMNSDYDDVGWKSMEHGNDRPFPAYIAQFEERDNSLAAGFTPILFLDIRSKSLFKDKKRQKPYLKIQ